MLKVGSQVLGGGVVQPDRSGIFSFLACKISST